MPKFINCRQRSPEWFAWRKDKISASNAAAAMGLSQFETPLMLYNRLQSDKKLEPTEAMDRGIKLEPEARKWAENQLGMEFPESCAEDGQLTWLIASLDGYNPTQNVAIEVKCMGKKGHHEASLGVVKPVYFPQLQCQMQVYNLDWMYYIAYDPEEGGEIIKVQRDDKFIEKMLPMLADFRQRLISFLPPDPMDKDLDDLSTNREAFDIGLELAEIQTRAKMDEMKEKTLRARLKEICNGRSCKVGDFRFVKFSRRGTVDYSLIPELQNVPLDKFRRPNVESWRFT